MIYFATNSLFLSISFFLTATESKVAHTIQKLLEGFENFEMDLDLLEENEGHRQPYTEVSLRKYVEIIT